MEETSSVGQEHIDIGIRRLAEAEKISVRSVNVCLGNGIRTLGALIEFFDRVGSFRQLPNAGKLVDEELSGICRKYSGASAEMLQAVLVAGDTFVAVDWSMLTAGELEAVESVFHPRMDALSRHAKKALKNLDPLMARNVMTFVDYFSDRKNRESGGIDRFAARVKKELLDLREEMVELSRNVRTRPIEEVMFEQVAELWKQQFGLGDADILRYRHDFLARRFPLFRFLQELVDRRVVISELELMTMSHRHGYITGSELLSSNELGRRLGVSGAWIRDKGENIPSKIRSLVAAAGVTNSFTDYASLSEAGGNLLVVDETLVARIGEREETSFALPFYTMVLEFLLQESHQAVGADYLRSNRAYLVRREMAAAFDFNFYMRDLRERSGAWVSREYRIDPVEQAKEFWKVESPERVAETIEICVRVAENEYGIISDADGTLVVPRNREKTLNDHIIDILEEAGHPLPLREIYKRLSERCPEVAVNRQTFGDRMNNNRYYRRFEKYGTYGLREWNEKYPDRHGRVADTTGRFHFPRAGMIGLKAKDGTGPSSTTVHSPTEVFDNLSGLIRDHGNQIALSRLIDYCVLHYRMPEQQARTLFERAILDNRFELREGEMVGVPEGEQVGVTE